MDQRLLAWQVHQDNLRAGMAEQLSIKKALLKALPTGTHGSTNRSRELQLWKDHDLWPPPEKDQAHRRQTPLDVAASSDPMEETMRMTTDEQLETMWYAGKSADVRHRETPQKPGLSDAEILLRAKELLMKDVFVAERPTTAKGRDSTLPTTMIAGRFPNDLVAELKALGGRVSHHLERALRLYLKVLKTE